MSKIALLLICIAFTSSSSSNIDLTKVNLLELEDYEFGSITDFVIHSDAIFISDNKYSKLHKFSLEGIHLKTTGGQGRGPGEFDNGPRLLAVNSDRLFVNSFAPWFHVFDLDLNYIEDQEVIKSALNLNDILALDESIYMIATQFYEEDLFVFNSSTGNLDRIKLGFKIEPGLLSKNTLLKVGNSFLFAWQFKNEFLLYNQEFKLKRKYKLEGIDDYAPGLIEPIKRIPSEVNSYQRKVYEIGTFTPQGTLFNSFIVKDDESFIAQLGTEGGLDKCLIISKSGEIEEEFMLPAKSKVLLAYHSGIIYTKDRKTEKVEAWKLEK